MQIVRPLSLMQVKIEDWSFVQSHTNLSYLVSVPNFRNKHWIREFSMKQFELQKPISQLFNALKSHFLHVNFSQIGCSEQSNKTHTFRKKSFLWCHHFRTLFPLISDTYWLLITFSMKIDEKSENPVSSISNINRLIAIDWFWLVSILIDWQIHWLCTPGIK